MRNGRVYAVDVNSDESATEVLVFEDGRPRVVDIGVARNLVDGEPAFREFSLLDASDRRRRSGMVRNLRRLSALPYPYCTRPAALAAAARARGPEIVSASGGGGRWGEG